MGSSEFTKMVRVLVESTKVTVNLRVAGTTLMSDLMDLIEHRTAVPVSAQRLICGGRELCKSRTLDELQVKTKETIHLLERPQDACMSWCATGTCKDNNCRLSHTHTVANSPRYVEHNYTVTCRRNISIASLALAPTGGYTD